jgi:hypothetical protein
MPSTGACQSGPFTWRPLDGCGAGLQEVADETAPGVGGGVGGGGQDAGVGHEEHRHVLGDEVGAQLPGGFGAVDERGEVAKARSRSASNCSAVGKVMVSTVVKPRSLACMAQICST